MKNCPGLKCLFALITWASFQAMTAGAFAADSPPQTAGGKECAHALIEVIKPHSVAEPHSPKPEAPAVIEALKTMIQAYSDGDLPKFEQVLDNDCTFFDEHTNKMLEGKPAVLAHVKELLATHAPGGSEPLISFKIDEPFVKVIGSMAVVTYRAVQEVGGKNPATTIKFATDIFVKDGDTWKLAHHRFEWQQVPKS